MIQCANCGELFERKIREGQKIVTCPRCKTKLVLGIDLSRECHDSCLCCGEMQRRDCAEIDEAIRKGDDFEHLIITRPWDGKPLWEPSESKGPGGPPSCCGQPMVEDWRLDNQFWIHVPVYRCQHCGHDEIRTEGI